MTDNKIRDFNFDVCQDLKGEQAINQLFPEAAWQHSLSPGSPCSKFGFPNTYPPDGKFTWLRVVKKWESAIHRINHYPMDLIVLSTEWLFIH